jgi:ubiquinone biosynthesis protein
LPQRFDVLTDRLERSELGLIWRWRDQGSFQDTLSKTSRRLTLAVLSVGCLLTGAILTASDRLATVPPQSDWVVWWHQSFLVAGVALALWIIAGSVVRR